MKIRIPQNWNIESQDNTGFILVNPEFPNWLLIWKYDKDGYNWHVEKLSESGRFKTGMYTFHKNFSGAIKDIK